MSKETFVITHLSIRKSGYQLISYLKELGANILDFFKNSKHKSYLVPRSLKVFMFTIMRMDMF